MASARLPYPTTEARSLHAKSWKGAYTARLGGMLSGKAGVVQFHMGVGKRGIDVLLAIVRETEIPARHFIPTHVNRAFHLFEQAKEFARLGGYVDITSGIREQDASPPRRQAQ